MILKITNNSGFVKYIKTDPKNIEKVTLKFLNDYINRDFKNKVLYTKISEALKISKLKIEKL